MEAMFMATGKKILELAAAEIGYREGKNKTNKFGLWYGMNHAAWCMIFCQYIYEMAGSPLPFRSASCSELLGWYKSQQPECIADTPVPGCLVIFDLPGTPYLTDHVGLFESMNGRYITTIDGNTSATNEANGGCVNRRVRRKNLVHAYIVPKELQEDDVMTGQEIYLALSEYLSKQELPNWAKKEFGEAVAMGLSDGSNPCLLAPRYQAVIMAKRAVEKAKN